MNLCFWRVKLYDYDCTTMESGAFEVAKEKVLAPTHYFGAASCRRDQISGCNCCVNKLLPYTFLQKAVSCHVVSRLYQIKWIPRSIFVLSSLPPEPNEGSWNPLRTPPALSTEEICKQPSQTSRNVGSSLSEYHCSVRMRLKMTFHLGTYSSCHVQAGLDQHG